MPYFILMRKKVLCRPSSGPARPGPVRAVRASVRQSGKEEVDGFFLVPGNASFFSTTDAKKEAAAYFYFCLLDPILCRQFVHQRFFTFGLLIPPAHQPRPFVPHPLPASIGIKY